MGENKEELEYFSLTFLAPRKKADLQIFYVDSPLGIFDGKKNIAHAVV